MYKSLLLGSVAVLGFASETPAFAQDTTGAGAQAPADGTARDGTAMVSTEQGGLADIVVTAERRAQNLQNAAIAVSAVTGDDLVSAGVSDVNNLSKLVPALVVAQSAGPATNFFIRGVGTFAQSILRENSIAFNFNGVYIGSPTAPIGTLYDLERVEVLKGPQGTLYGRNATGGSINVIPRRPTLNDVNGDISVEYGNYDAKKATGGINIPLGATVAVRAAGQVVDRDGYLSDGTDADGGGAGRLSLLFEPQDNFSVTLVGDYFKQWSKGSGGVLIPSSLVPTAPPPSDRIGASDPRSTAELLLRFPTVRSGLVSLPANDGYNRSENFGVAATIEGKFDFGTATMIAAYRRSRPNYLNYSFGYGFQGDETNTQMTLEARLASNSAQRLRYVVGAFLFLENKNGFDRINQGPIQITRYQVKQNSDSYAVFGQGTYDLLDDFRLVAGIRYTHEDKTINAQFTQTAPGILNPPVRQIPGDVAFNSTTYKVGFEYDAGPRSLVYGSLATGFKAGGFFLSAVNNAYQPEKLTAFTLGSKNRFLDNRLQVNLETFYWKYKDQQVTYVGPIQNSPGVFVTSSITANVGRGRTYGADLEIRYQLSPNDLLGIDVQYLNSRYTSFNYLQLSNNGAPPRVSCAVAPNNSLPIAPPARLFNVDCSGKSAISAPEWSANLSYQHSFDLGGDYALVPSARTRLETSRYLSLEYLPEEQQGSYMTSDLALTLEGPGDRWALTAYVNNVENETILSGSAGLRPFLNVAYATLRPPRTYGARATIKF